MAQPYEFKNLHLAGVIELLKGEHDASMKASDNDPEGKLSVDSEKIEICRRLLNGIASGTIEAEDTIQLEGSKKAPEEHGDEPPHRPTGEVARGDTTRASDHLAFDRRGNAASSIEAIFASDNASRVTAKHSIDAVFGESERGAGRHEIDGIFG